MLTVRFERGGTKIFFNVAYTVQVKWYTFLSVDCTGSQVLQYLTHKIHIPSLTYCLSHDKHRRPPIVGIHVPHDFPQKPVASHHKTNIEQVHDSAPKSSFSPISFMWQDDAVGMSTHKQSTDWNCPLRVKHISYFRLSTDRGCKHFKLISAETMSTKCVNLHLFNYWNSMVSE